MLELKSIGFYKSIHYERDVFIIECPYDLDRHTVGKHFIGNDYVIDGEVRRIVDVELNIAKTGIIKKGEKIGLATSLYEPPNNTPLKLNNYERNNALYRA